MSNIAITLNDVIRNYSNTLEKCYLDFEKFKLNLLENSALTESSLVIDEDVLVKIENKKEKFKIPYIDDPLKIHSKYDFLNKEEYENFIHDHLFKINGLSGLISPDNNVDFNKFYALTVKLGNICTLISQEIGKSKSATFYWLSTNNVLPNKVSFLGNYSKVWETYDTIITANPYILKNCDLNNKTSIKILTQYNKDIESTITLNNFNEIFDHIYD